MSLEVEHSQVHFLTVKREAERGEDTVGRERERMVTQHVVTLPSSINAKQTYQGCEQTNIDKGDHHQHAEHVFD